MQRNDERKFDKKKYITRVYTKIGHYYFQSVTNIFTYVIILKYLLLLFVLYCILHLVI